MARDQRMYTTIKDATFQRTVSLADAYMILERFVAQYNTRGERSTVEFLTDVGLSPDGTSADPAQIYDFITFVQAAFRGNPRS